MMIVCSKCRGQKNVIGIGYMEVTCPVCHGIGKVKMKEVKDDREEEASEEKVVKAIKAKPKAKAKAAKSKE